METKSSDGISDPSLIVERTSHVPESAAPPGVGRVGKGRRADRDDLEQRLAAIAENVRVQSEQAEWERREQTQLEARVHLEGIKPVVSHPPDRIEGVKVVLASGLDPRQDPTLVGRRNGEDAWEFGVVEDAEAVDPGRGGAQDPGARTRAGATKATGDAPRSQRVIFAMLGGAAVAVLLLLVLFAR